MIRTATAIIVQLAEILKIQMVYHAVDYAHGVVFRNILVSTLRKKDNLFGIVIPKVYLCHVIDCIPQRY